MAFRIRRACLSDASAACEVVRRSIGELCKDDHQDDAETLAEWLKSKTPASFERWIRSEQHVALVAEHDRGLVGFGLLNLEGWIALLYVAPEARFTGVSKKLLSEIERAAIDRGIGELRSNSSSTAARFYESVGYRRTGDAYAGFGVTTCYPLSRQIRSS